MRITLIQRIFARNCLPRKFPGEVFERSRTIWDGLAHLGGMGTQRLSGLGLEPVLTTSELAEYVVVHVQAIYDLRANGRGPSGFRVGREICFRVSDVVRWLDDLHEEETNLADLGAHR